MPSEICEKISKTEKSFKVGELVQVKCEERLVVVIVTAVFRNEIFSGTVLHQVNTNYIVGENRSNLAGPAWIPFEDCLKLYN